MRAVPALRRMALLAATALAFGACYGTDPNATGASAGTPEITLDFPAQADTGSTQTLTIEVTNPGPEAMQSVFVAFALVGIGGTEGVPRPVVVPGKGRSRSVVAIDPKPLAVSEGGAVYKFALQQEGVGKPFLAEGDSVTVTFDLLLPATPDTYGNSVQVYDGSDPQRSAGELLKVEVR